MRRFERLAEAVMDDDIEGIAGFFDELFRVKTLRPRMDFRPALSVLLDDGVIEGSAIIEDDEVREKKGMPEGVRRGLNIPVRVFEGLVVMMVGVPAVVSVSTVLVLIVRLRSDSLSSPGYPPA